MAERGRFTWWLPASAAVVSLAVFTSISILQADTFLFLSLLVVGPILVVASLALLVYVIIRRRKLLSAAAVLAIFWASAVALFLYNREHPFEIRESARWVVYSREYKTRVLAQLAPANGDLKHIEWDASGFAGIANNTAYLVFDPEDELSMAARSSQSAKFNGVPCAVRTVRRLESHWYAVLLYTDQVWDRCN